MNYEWRFNELRPSDKAREPIHGEFFADDSIKNPGEALIREGIQNSLDARRETNKVLIRIRVGNGIADIGQDISCFFNGLTPHLLAPRNGLRDVPKREENFSFVVFEDFGTTGLTGDTSDWKPNPSSRNNFYHFFRAEGRSDKEGTSIGRWGIGKQVFMRASRINTIFGLTVRSDDQKRLLMGMAVLKSHDINNRRYAPDGWLGKLDEQIADGFVVPIDDPSFIEKFVQTFDVQRGHDPGLSIVIPWCDPEVTDKTLISAVIRDYFWPILCSTLEVIVETPKFQTVLDARSIRTEIAQIGSDFEQEILPLCKLGEWAISLPTERFVKLLPPQNWSWAENMFPPDILALKQKAFSEGEKIAIRVPVTITRKERSAEESYFDVFLHRDGSEQHGKPVYIREGMIIPNVRRYGSSALRGVRAIVMAEHRPIAALLGDAENPAHTQWQKDGANFKGKYKDGPKILDFVIQSAMELAQILGGGANEEDPNLLVDLFSLPVPPNSSTTRLDPGLKQRKKGTEPEIPSPPESRPRLISIERTAGGFEVCKGNATETIAGKSLTIRVAYDVRNGNAFKKYMPADFDFSGDLDVQVDGCTVCRKDDNILLLHVENDDFFVKVVGFDPKRDVRVEARLKEEQDAASEA